MAEDWKEELGKFLDMQDTNKQAGKFLNMICTKGYTIPAVYNVWYKAKNTDELSFVIKWFSADVKQIHGQKDLRVGEWFTVTLEYIPNNGWSRTFFTLKNYKKAVNKMFIEINKIKEELE